MSKINSLPKGLQEYLGNTSQGVNPSDLHQAVSPVIDLQPFWSADKVQNQIVTAAFTTPNNGAFITVPPGELWFPKFMSARITGLAIADVVRFNVGVLTPASVRVFIKSSETYTATAIDEVFEVSHEFSRLIGIPAGWFFGAALQSIAIAAPSENISLAIAYVRVKV